MSSIISKHTIFLLKVDLHCILPHFRNVSDTSGVTHSILRLVVLSLPIVAWRRRKGI